VESHERPDPRASEGDQERKENPQEHIQMAETKGRKEKEMRTLRRVATFPLIVIVMIFWDMPVMLLRRGRPNTPAAFELIIAWSEDAIQKRETTKVPLGEETGDRGEVRGGLRNLAMDSPIVQEINARIERAVNAGYAAGVQAALKNGPFTREEMIELHTVVCYELGFELAFGAGERELLKTIHDKIKQAIG